MQPASSCGGLRRSWRDAPTGVAMLIFAALQPLIVRLTRTPVDGMPSAIMLLILLIGIGYLGGFVAARWEQDEADA